MEMPRITDDRTYPAGVPSWIDVASTEPEATCAFYGDLFGWTFEDMVPPEAPGSYFVARLDGHDVAAVRPDADENGWASYIATDDVDALAARVTAAGGTVIDEPADVGPAGRGATLADPEGAVFRGWQAGTRLGAQLVNVPGAWVFSVLQTPDRDRSLRFYSEVLGWEQSPDLGAGMFRLPGYGEHLADTIDPGIRERQAFVPPGFADVVAGLVDGPAPARWVVSFSVADRDRTVERAVELGATVLSTENAEWTHEAELLDIQGAAFTISQLVKTS
jgi:uncharacterized protein